MQDSLDLGVSLLPWQTEVFSDTTRFKIVAAGRRCGKSRLAAWTLLINALDEDNKQVFYVAPTQGAARDILWDVLMELGQKVIKGYHINNLQIQLINGSKISLKGADRPDTMRGVSLKYLVMDEYAFMKPDVWELILRPALADQQGHALFIGTPDGRNHFYDLYNKGALDETGEYKSWHFTSYDNALIPQSELDNAKATMSSYAFRQEFMASFEARDSELFSEDWLRFSDVEPNEGTFYIAGDLAGFEEMGKPSNKKKNRLDDSSFAVVKVNSAGWWVAEIVHGRWTLDETVQKLFDLVQKYRPAKVGLEKGIAKQAVMSPLEDMMRRRAKWFEITELTHGNVKKVDRIVWALQGRMENGYISLNKGDWNIPFMDQLFQFPNPLVHDDLIDSLAYIDQLAEALYVDPSLIEMMNEPDEWALDIHSGY